MHQHQHQPDTSDMVALADKLADPTVSLEFITVPDGANYVRVFYVVSEPAPTVSTGTTCLCYYGEPNCPVCPNTDTREN